ncbi:MAG: AAA family ATPase [Succinatimonas sp.]|jgi:hypothetical protein|nr:AAA family ATPase [Succinatimonas sp.]MDD5868212.1 AAA family ATPase [Succinatimonas sp.]
MIFKRKIYESLLKWKSTANGKWAVLIEGARRIGKSTIAEQFAKEQYKSYLLINFSIAPNEVKEVFRNNLENLDVLFMFLQTYYHVNLQERDSLIIFDEVQAFPRAREAIKFLVADGRYDYLETGSLISIKQNVKDIVIPSEEMTMNMYPLDFEEFCEAMGNTQIIKYIHYCFEKQQPLERGIHNQAMLLFKQYMLTGGMPESVSAFIDSKLSFTQCDTTKRLILNLYLNDIQKIKDSDKGKVAAIFDSIPSSLSRHDREVVFSNIIPGSTYMQFDETFYYLKSSMMCNLCFNVTDPSVALSLNEDRASVKCYLSDTGLLISQAFNEKSELAHEVYKQILFDKLKFNNGMFYENAIAQMLVATGHKLFFYKHYNKELHRNDMEIDFIITDANSLKYKICPIEVKSTTRYQINSLKKFVDKYHERISKAYVIHPANFKIKDGITYIPSYMTICLM